MRLRKLVPALIAATSLLALAPAAASAHKHPSPSGRCRINVNVAPREITVGDQVLVSGRLACDRHANAAGQVVKLYEHAAGSPGYSPVQSTTTDTNGGYEFSLTDVNTNSSFYVRSHGAQSGHKRIRVIAQVTLSGPAEGTLLTGVPNQVTFTGTVNPADVGARVILQRENSVTGNEWHRIGFGQVEAGGSYSITHTFRVPGDASIRVLVRSQGVNVPSESNILEYEISQTQNPSLTINASVDPIVYGQSVTITGVVAGAAASHPVTLLARTVHQHGFAPVAEATTDASGNYSFAAQSPVNSTLYEVSTADSACAAAPAPVKACKARRLRSAVLYEGVKDLLTAQVSQTTVQAGQPLTFSGTVAPDHTGHVVYLERQNAGGTGFHVVQVATVQPGSTFSIVHQVYVAGTKVFRVDIPGGPENGRAVSQPFTIVVTPAPASAITPEAPGNSSQPGEGES